MPVLMRDSNLSMLERGEEVGARFALEPAQSAAGGAVQPAPGKRGALFAVCAYAGCRAGWLRLWRSRSTPVFESGWCCSPDCTRGQVEIALRREMGSRAAATEAHRHRVPLGLAMLERGWITAEVLRRALAAQRAANSGRIGYWLRREGVNERLIARALGLQWSCPVFSTETSSHESLTALVPRLFLDAFGALPLRVAAERVLYLGFEDRLDPSLSLAIERITGLRVESGMVDESRFRRAHTAALEARYPGVELVEAASESVLAAAMAKAIERARPVESKLVRVHECVWLRMWLRSQSGAIPALDSVLDLIGSVRAFSG